MNIVVTAIVVRILAPQDFGIYAIALTVHMVVISIGSLGVSGVLVRVDWDVDEVASTVAAIGLLTSLAFSLAVLLLAHPLAVALGSAQAAAPIRVMSLSLFLSGCFPVPIALLSRDFRAKEAFIANMAGLVPANVLLIVLALNGGGAMSFAWSMVVEHAITGLMAFYFVRRFDFPVLKWDVTVRVARFGLPLAGANVVSSALLNADFVVVGHSLGAERLGVYALAFNIASWPTTLLGATITGVAVPAFSRLSGDADRARRAVLLSTRAVGLIAFPICAAVLAIALALIQTIYGNKWSPAAPVLSTLIVYGAISAPCLLYGGLIVGRGTPRAILLLQLLWLLALIPAMVLGVHWRGIVGAGEAHVVVIVLVVLPAYLIALSWMRMIHVRDVLIGLIPPASGAVVCWAAARIVAACVSAAPLKVVLGGSAGVAAYVLVMAPLLAPMVVARIPASGPLRRLISAYGDLGSRLGHLIDRVLPFWVLVGR
jgi:PST family polysaccharide transporter